MLLFRHTARCELLCSIFKLLYCTIPKSDIHAENVVFTTIILQPLFVCNAQVNSFPDHITSTPNNRYHKHTIVLIRTHTINHIFNQTIFKQKVYSELRIVTSGNCACSGDDQIYECTVVGGLGGITVWRGTVFNCEVGAEINLLHSQFVLEQGAFGSCNSGAIRGKSLRIENNRYISQLSVTLSDDMSGETIECVYDDGMATTIIGNYSLNLIIGSVNYYLFLYNCRIIISSSHFTTNCC